MDRGSYQKLRQRKRFEVPCQARFLTFSCWQKLPLLNKDRTRTWFLEYPQAAREWHKFQLWAYVLMPEHAHLLILPASDSSVSAILKSVKAPMSKRAVYWVRKNCPKFLGQLMDRQPSGRGAYRFWQPGGGYDRNVFSAQELHEKLRYIHANPVRRGLVESPGLWRWSSFNAWETGVDDPIAIDRGGLPALDG